MEIKIKRVYEKPEPEDGTRILVDRLWPRGLKKEAAKVDHWMRAISPSNDLRKWYAHDPDKWPEFQKRYGAELNGLEKDVDTLIEILGQGPATFLYSSTEQKINNAWALKLYLEKRMSKRNKPG
ncbi:MAG: DUF488 family protein [Syntrophales bacterium]|nr:DUF488 family protein [Syntrophales bacterium]